MSRSNYCNKSLCKNVGGATQLKKKLSASYDVRGNKKQRILKLFKQK